MTKRYRIIMQSREMFDVEAETEEEAYEIISVGEIEPIFKKYFGDDIVVTGENYDDIEVNGKRIGDIK